MSFGQPWYFFPATEADIILFRHPSLTRLRIQFADLTAFGQPSIAPLPTESLRTLWVEATICSLEALRKILLRVGSLETFDFDHSFRPLSFEPSEFTVLLSACQTRLTSLKLRWDRDAYGLSCPWSLPRYQRLSFSSFPALRYLMISPQMMIGSYGEETDYSAIQQRFPTGLKVLYLYEFVKPDHSSSAAPSEMLAPDRKLLLALLGLEPKQSNCLQYLIYSDIKFVLEPTDIRKRAKDSDIELVGVNRDYNLTVETKWLQK